MRSAALVLLVTLVGAELPAPAGAQSRSVLLEEMTWREVEAAIAGGVDTAVVTVGATEQHGPQIALSSDSVTGDFIGPEVARMLGGALVAPNIRLGVSGHHMLFPGTITVRPTILFDLLREYVHALAWHGFRHIVILPTHGGNFGTIDRVVRELSPFYPHVNIAGYTNAPAYIETLQGTSRRLGIPLDVAGSHAGQGETAMVLAIRPDLVRPERAEPGFMGDAYGAGERMNREGTQAVSPLGVLGDPRGATAEAGQAYLRDLSAHLAGFARKAREAWRPAALTELPYGGLPDPTGPLADGVRLRRAGRYAEARAVFESLRRQGLQEHAAVVELARTHVLEGRRDNARRELEPLVSHADPAVAESAHDELAMVELYDGRFDAAIEHKRAARRLRAATGDRVGQALKLFYVGYIESERRRFDEAAAAYTEALGLAPEVSAANLDVEHLLGVLEVARGNLIQAAARLRALEDGALQKPFAAHIRRVYHLHGEILLARGRTEDALRNFAPAIRIYDHPLYREALARAYRQAGRLADAEVEYRHLLELRDARLDVPIHYVKAHYALGQLYDSMGRTAEALTMYRKFIALWGAAEPALPGVAEAKARLAKGGE